jgi:phospholipase C
LCPRALFSFWSVADRDDSALSFHSETWLRTLLIITYDEHGGLYDHAVPPLAEVITLRRPDERVDDGGPAGGAGPVGSGGVGGTGGGAGGGRLTGLFGRLRDVLTRGDPRVLVDPNAPPPPQTRLDIPYGVRVPTFVISPWVPPGKGPSVVLDHTSILKTVLARFAGDFRPFLSERVAASHSFESFLTAPSPRLDVPPPEDIAQLPVDARRLAPGASQIVTPPLSRRRMREEGIDYHDLSGWVARMLGR